MRLPAIALTVLALLAASGGTAAAAAPENGRCRLPKKASVVLRTPSAIVYYRTTFGKHGDGTDLIAGCLKSRGDRFRLAGVSSAFEVRSELLHVVVAGRYAALAIGYGGRSGASTTMTSFDLRTGEREKGLQLDSADGTDDRVVELRVNTSGDLGWIASSYNPGTAQGDGTQRGQGVFSEVHSFDARGDVLLDSGAAGAFTRLRMYGRSISWAIPDGTRRSAPLVEPGGP